MATISWGEYAIISPAKQTLEPLLSDRVAYERVVVLAVLAGDLLAQVLEILLERLVGRLMRLAHPP